MMAIQMHTCCVRVKHCGRFCCYSVHINFKFMEKDLSDMNEIKSVEWPKWPDNTFKTNIPWSTDGFLLEKKNQQILHSNGTDRIFVVVVVAAVAAFQFWPHSRNWFESRPHQTTKAVKWTIYICWAHGNGTLRIHEKESCIFNGMAFVVKNYYASNWNE